jgi:hypothetical protein
MFTLVVDDFGIKYNQTEDLDHLLNALRELYQIKVNMNGDKYLGFKIEFNDEEHTVSLSMPDYIPKVLQRFAPGQTLKGVRSPAVYEPPKFGKKGPPEVQIDNSEPLNDDEVKRVQEIVGSILFYARAVDCTMLPAVQYIAARQSQPTRRIMDSCNRLLRYAAANPAQQLVFRACDMILYVHSDASHQSLPESRSVAGGIHYLGNKDGNNIVMNGPLLAVTKVITSVTGSAGESEYAACYINAQQAVWLRVILAALGYPQPITQIISDNQCAVGLANQTLKPKRSKAIDMRYHWIRDRIKQGEISVSWRKGAENIADFFTKALPVHKHVAIQKLLMSNPADISNPSLMPSRRRAKINKK